MTRRTGPEGARSRRPRGAVGVLVPTVIASLVCGGSVLALSVSGATVLSGGVIDGGVFGSGVFRGDDASRGGGRPPMDDTIQGPVRLPVLRPPGSVLVPARPAPAPATEPMQARIAEPAIQIVFLRPAVGSAGTSTRRTATPAHHSVPAVPKGPEGPATPMHPPTPPASAPQVEPVSAPTEPPADSSPAPVLVAAVGEHHHCHGDRAGADPQDTDSAHADQQDGDHQAGDHQDADHRNGHQQDADHQDADNQDAEQQDGDGD